MNLGFYYHSTFKLVNNRIYVPGYIGVFIDELANQNDKLYLFLEKQVNPKSTDEDYELLANNIELVDLGYKSSFYSRLLTPGKIIAKMKMYESNVDSILVRCPTPLAPHIFKSFRKKTPVFPLLVGNYINGLKDLKQPFVRKVAIKALTHYYQFLQNKMVKGAVIFVNSVLLAEENKRLAKQITLIKTTTLTLDSFFVKTDTCQNNAIKLLFTGRINFQKGLRELIEATSIVNQKHDIQLNIVGWEDGDKQICQNHLNKLAEKLGIKDKIVFHGKKKVGPELQHFYQTNDIYIIPSYHEGFPRTIWEAMASSTPVIATSVGSIPYYLSDKENAYIINPRDVSQIVMAVEEIIANKELRVKLITNAFQLVSNITLEKQTQLLLESIKLYSQSYYE